MSRFFYPKLAITNIRNNSKTYIPYILTCIGTIMMYYILYALSVDDALKSMYGGMYTQQMLILGTGVIAIFAAIFLLYTNSFLMKRRKKEFGLFNILGMEKKHISRIMFYETFFIAIGTLIFGILFGILFSKLVLLILLKILQFDVKFGFSVSYRAINATLILFGIIFIAILLNNLRQIHLSKPIELLKGGQTGEKEPKTKWLLSLIGFISLGAGYYIAISTKDPIAAMYMFFVAVILVIIGTFCLFTAGSIMILKILRKNKKYYYKTKHFISVSGMIYRMKQNAAGLANICILSTMVLVMISSTVSLYIGMEDIVRSRYPRNIMLTCRVYETGIKESYNKVIDETLEKHNLELKNKVDYRFISFSSKIDKSEIILTDESSYNNSRLIYVVPLEDYNDLIDDKIELKDNEVLMYSNRDAFIGDSVNILGKEYSIKEHLQEFFNDGSSGMNVLSSHYIITNDMNMMDNLLVEVNKVDKRFETNMEYYLGFDLDANQEENMAVYNDLVERLNQENLTYYIDSSAGAKEEFYGIYGGLFFLGIFLGLLFIMATVLIMYYKQISEGYDDKERFEIMQKVGMSHSEIKGSIRSQVLTVFFLPIITAAIHIAFAFPIITRVLAIINLTNTNLFAICTVASILIFTIFYAIVYTLTAKTYYKIVR